jgi:predicted transcriptional regulator
MRQMQRRSKQFFCKRRIKLFAPPSRLVHKAVMKLNIYLTEKGIREADFAALIGVNQSTVYRLCKNGQVPSKDLMATIFKLTGGAVTANDFFGIGDS